MARRAMVFRVSARDNNWSSNFMVHRLMFDFCVVLIMILLKTYWFEQLWQCLGVTFVFLQMLLASETLATSITAEQLFFGMSSRVFSQVTCLGESLPTFNADKWFGIV